MKYKNSSVAFGGNNRSNIVQAPVYWMGTVETKSGIVEVYMQGWPSETNPNYIPTGGEYTRCRMVLNGRIYTREFHCMMSRKGLIRTAHKFARDVAEGRVE